MPCIEGTGPGQRLRDLRVAADLSTADLSAATGLSRGYISHLERGHHDPKLGSVPRLAQAYGLTVVEFLKLWFREECDVEALAPGQEKP